MNDQEERGTAEEPRGEASRSDLVRIRLPGGGWEWVTPEAFNLISEKEFLDSHRLRRLRRQRDAALAAAVVALLALAAVFLAWALRGRPAPAAPEAPAVAEEPAAAAASAPPAALTEPAAAPETSAPPVAPAVDREIEDTVQAWARAWSERDVERYLGFYSPEFRVPDGLDRGAWEGLRRRRIEGPEWIAVTVSDVEATLAGDGRAIARFGQGYRSPGYRDWVLKTLELVREPEGWRIVGERSSLIEIGGRGRETPDA